MSDSDMIPSERGNSTFYRQGRRLIDVVFTGKRKGKGRSDGS